MFRFLARFIGLWLLAAAAAAAVVDAARTIADGWPVMTPLGQAWTKIHGASMALAQAAVEKHMRPEMWDPVIVTVLKLPAFLVAGVLAALFFLIGRPRKDPFEKL